jgi:microcompartment protein CcmK/EutM
VTHGGIADDAHGGMGAAVDSHWVQWHRDYEDSASRLNVRLRLVQAAIRAALEEVLASPGPRREIRVVSICAGQGRDVIDVVAGLAGEGAFKGADVRCLLVELDPALVEFARHRVAEAALGTGTRAVIEVLEGDASLSSHYAAHVPADAVVVCGVFGNISEADMHHTIEMMPSWLTPGGSVVWTRHRRDPDLTPTVRRWFLDAGLEEVSFESPDGFVLSVGRHRRPASDATVTPFDPDAQLFTFVGDGSRPA